jgi:hypothetical protein
MTAKNTISLERLIEQYLADFQKIDSGNAQFIEEALKIWGKEKRGNEFLDWWKVQNPQWIAALQSFMFWLLTTKKIKQQLFEETYSALTPVLSKSWNMPIVITTGMDEPLFEDGFINRNFSFFQYKFSPADRGLIVEYQEYPQHSKKRIGLDFILDFLSFLAEKGGVGYLGFRQIQSRKQTSSETKLLHIGSSPVIRYKFPDYDFEYIELGLGQVNIQDHNNVVSITELLHIRHRAILDSNPESKLITLWSFIEGYWGEDDNQDKLLSASELKIAKDGLKFLPLDKFDKAINLLNKLKNKTRNDKIIEKIKELDCTKGWDDETVRQIHSLRSKFSHGQSMSPEEQEETNRFISFMLQIIDELITQKFSQYNIKF